MPIYPMHNLPKYSVKMGNSFDTSYLSSIIWLQFSSRYYIDHACFIIIKLIFSSHACDSFTPNHPRSVRILTLSTMSTRTRFFMWRICEVFHKNVFFFSGMTIGKNSKKSFSIILTRNSSCNFRAYFFSWVFATTILGSYIQALSVFCYSRDCKVVINGGWIEVTNSASTVVIWHTSNGQTASCRTS